MMRTTSLPACVLRRGLLAGSALTTALMLSACGGGDSTSSSDSGHGSMTMAPGSAPASNATFNDADVSFAQSMIVHHRQAIEMASLADSRAAGAKVKELAGKIKAAQQPEIDTMNGWLTAWGEPAASMSPNMGAMDHSSMPGMMAEADMRKLGAAKGAAFDKQFLTMMISHHQGAITTAKQETAAGSNPDATGLAEKIITAQQAEITTMKDLLATL